MILPSLVLQLETRGLLDPFTFRRWCNSHQVTVTVVVDVAVAVPLHSSPCNLIGWSGAVNSNCDCRKRPLVRYGRP